MIPDIIKEISLKKNSLIKIAIKILLPEFRVLLICFEDQNLFTIEMKEFLNQPIRKYEKI